MAKIGAAVDQCLDGRRDAVHGTKSTTPVGTATARYIEWQSAKYGKISVQDFAKLHLIHTPYGNVCAAMVTPGKAGGSPYLREMIEMMPDGSGDVLGSCAGGSPRSI